MDMGCCYSEFHALCFSYDVILYIETVLKQTRLNKNAI